MEILRIILITFGSIAGFFVFAVMLFLFCPIKTEIVYGESKFVRIRFLFFRYTFISRRYFCYYFIVEGGLKNGL